MEAKEKAGRGRLTSHASAAYPLLYLSRTRVLKAVAQRSLMPSTAPPETGPGSVDSPAVCATRFSLHVVCIAVSAANQRSASN